MDSYRIVREGNVMKVGFGIAAQNDVIVQDAATRLVEMDQAGELEGGGVIKINGPASLPVAVVLAHVLVHKFSAVGVFDPKLNKYVVAVSHNPAVKIGDLLD